MKCSAERLIEAIIGSELAMQRKAAEQRAAAERRSTYVVTVSRGYGALGKQIAQRLADTLGVRCCDRMILQEVAKRAHVDDELVRRLDEHVGTVGTEWWKSIVAGKSYSRERYYEHLVKVIMNISTRGGVIVGRGAHLILGPARCFRVRIVGSPDSCAERISRREGIDLERALQRVDEVDRERDQYLRDLYGECSARPSNFDLMLNTDRFSMRDAIGLIIEAMQRAGYTFTPEILHTAQV